MRHVLFWLALSLTAPCFAAGEEVAVFQIMSRPAASLVEAVRPLVGDNGGVSAFHDRLVVRAEPAAIAAVRRFVAEIDRPPRRLLIEVRQHSSLARDADRLDYGVDTGEVRLGRPPPQGTAGIAYFDARTRARGDSLQRVQALDGRPALIRAGQAMPVYQTHQQIIGHTVVQGFNVQYRDVDQGFLALPRVHGDQVTVEIYQRSDRPGPGGVFNTQSADTVLSGTLGQWLELGTIGDVRTDTDDQLGRYATTRRAEERTLELRVLAVD